MTTADEIATDLAAALEAVRKVFDQLVAGIPGYETAPGGRSQPRHAAPTPGGEGTT